MAIRFTGTYGTTYGNSIKVEIHDTDFTGTATGITFTSEGLMEKSEGEYLDIIKTTNYKCTIYLDSTEVNSFFDDLINEDEGRFHLVVYRGTTLLFKGRIIVDSMVREDSQYPMFTFQAIDGLTLLKSVDYQGTTSTILTNVRNLILNCLLQNDVVNKMYASSDKLLVIASNLQFNDAYYDGFSFYENAYNRDYFFKLDGNKEERLKAWDVLTEVLTKYGLTIRYWKGIYYVFGNEWPAEAWNSAAGYKKDRSTIGIPVSQSAVNIDNIALRGGKWQYENGLKEVLINAKKDFANAYLGENFIWPKATTSYQTIGSMVHDLEYKGLVTIDITKLVLGATGPYPPFFSVKMWIKETNLTNNTVSYLRTTPQQIVHHPSNIFTLNNSGSTEDHTEIVYVLQTGKFETQFKIPLATYDRKIEVKFQFYQYLKYDYTSISGSPNVTTLDYNYKLKAGEEPLSTAKEIYFKASVDSDNVRNLTRNIYAPDYNGNDLGKTYFWDGGSGEVNKSNNNWRYSNSESWGPLEPTICRKIMEYNEANIVKIMIPCNVPMITVETAGIAHIFLTKFTYKSVNYFTYGVEIDHFNDIIRLEGFRVNTKSTKSLTTYNVRSEETNPEGKETVGDTSNFGSFFEFQKGKTEVHVMDVVGDDLQIDYDIPTGSSFNSIRQSIRVYVDGVRWRHVATLVTDNANRSTYTLGDSGLIVFWPAIPNRKVIVDIDNYFETGISV